MKRNQKLSPVDRAFLAEVRAVEERLYPALLDPAQPRRVLGARRYREFRPSHHVSRGLVGAADLAAMSAPGRRALSVGAYPAIFERLLCELGVPAGNLVVADHDPDIVACAGPMAKVAFDMLGPWPDLGTFDLILFPESLCMGLGDRVAEAEPQGKGPFPGDALAGRLLAGVLGEAMARLRPGGEIRADGPMSHPNVVRAASAALDAAGHPHRLRYERFFLWLRPGEPPSECSFADR